MPGPVLTQRVAGASSGISRSLPSCQSQTIRAGASVTSAARGSPTGSGPLSAVRRSKEQPVSHMMISHVVTSVRSDSVSDLDFCADAAQSTSALGAGQQPDLPTPIPGSQSSSIVNQNGGVSQDVISQQQAHRSPQPMPLHANQPSASGLRPPCPLSTSDVSAIGSSVPTSVLHQTVCPLDTTTASEPFCHHLPATPSTTSTLPGNIVSSCPFPDPPSTTSTAPTAEGPLITPLPSPGMHSPSAPCSPASSVNLSGPSVIYSGPYAAAFTPIPCRMPSSPGIGGLSLSPIAQPISSTGGGSSSFAQAYTYSYPRLSHGVSPSQAHAAAVAAGTVAAAGAAALLQSTSAQLVPAVSMSAAARQITPAASEPRSAHPTTSLPAACMPTLASYAVANTSASSSARRSSLRDQNSVTIKATTVVKDAAGAIDKILSRGVTALVTALRSGVPPYDSSYDSLNQAVKAIAVARQYAKETGLAGAEVTFLPFHRFDSTERPDPSRFAFLVFPLPRLSEALKTADETVLNVARGSDVHKMAGAIIAVMLDRGQAVMKAAGSEAIFVAMSAVVNARHRLIQKHGFDLMLAAAWITEDTQATMGRESKFLRFNILKTVPAGPRSAVPPSLTTALESC